jgi:transposase
MHPAVTLVPPKSLAELQELVLARQSLKADETALDNRIEAAETGFLKRLLGKQLAGVKDSVRRIDERIVALIAAGAALQRRFDILVSIKGIGPIVAATLVGCLAELGQLSRGGIALLAGLAPLNCDSGKMRGQRHIKGGSGPVRASLYMAAICASRCNPDLRAFYQRLRQEGKPAKIALTAVMPLTRNTDALPWGFDSDSDDARSRPWPENGGRGLSSVG